MKPGVKSTFSTIFLLLVLTLMFLPFLTTFNEFLTALFLKIGWYKAIQNFLLPFETRLIVVVMGALGQKAIAALSTISVLRDNTWQKIAISWNCIGWQSILALGVTLLTGLQGPYALVSKLECLLIGVFGTFLVNILRISLLAILIVYINAIPTTVAHDYLSAIILIFWLFFFWWFSYSFVLEERQPTVEKEEAMKV